MTSKERQASDDHPRPTMDDVANEAGVSRALVSLVMRGSSKVSKQRREAVLSAAETLGYRPNAAARSLASRRSETLGIVVNDLHNMFFADVVDGIQETAAEHNYRLLIKATWRQYHNEERAIEAFIEHRVDAILVLGPRTDLHTIQDAAKSVPIVVTGTMIPGVDVVMNDDERGAELVVEHLVDLGHSEIVHIDGGAGAGADNRRKGFVAAMEASGLYPRIVPGDFSEEAGSNAVDFMLDEGTLPTAIFAANDLSALSALDRLNDAGLSIPGDVSLVGYDNLSIAGLRHVGLSTVDQPRVATGRLAAKRAFERILEGRRAPSIDILTPTLIHRKTSGKVTNHERA